jgi:membrane protein required for colicin V production
MNWLDILLSVMLMLSVAAGFARGFVRTVVGLLSTIVAVLLSIWFYRAVGAMFADYVKHAFIADAIGFAMVFLGTLAAGSVLGYGASKILRWAGLGWMDRLAGGGLGFARGLLMATAIVLAIFAFSRNPPPAAVTQSYLAPYVIELSKVMSYMAPQELRTHFTDNYAKIKKVWGDMVKLVPART